VVVNGMLFSVGSGLEAFSLTGARTASVSHRRVGRPDPRQLRPTIRAHRGDAHRDRRHGRVMPH
jgi:hypothetical protein